MKDKREARREKVSHDESKRKENELLCASLLAESVLEGLRTRITIGRGGLKFQLQRDRFDRLVCDGLRKMIGDE